MPFFKSRDGVRLHYAIEGSGRPLLLHLGAGADSDLWRAAGYVEPLARTYRCILFDHRGHGASDHPASPAANHIDRYADDVVDLVRHLGLSAPAFFGWSNGISVGLRAADLRPGLFGALVLFGGIGRRTGPDQLVTATAERLEGIREKGWDSILDDMVAAERYPVPAWFLERVRATDTAPWFAFTQARPDWNWSLWDALPRVRCPALLLAGELEDPEDIVGEVAAALPDARRVRIPDREHINAFLASELVVPIVQEFLAGNSG
jgi:pimeloyl-ACP methyl ester carboxylesterase